MPRDLHDHYFKQAKREGYRSRAAYKLMEIDDRKQVLSRGDAVLDCGCAPGSWLQVAASRVGGRGIVVGIDLQRVEPLPAANVRIIEGDLASIDAAALLARISDSGSESRFDVILSDMAPATTGERAIDHHQSVRLCHAVLDRCAALLKPGGNCVMKVFEGEAYRDLLDRASSMFESAKGFRPASSRDESTEIYIIAHCFRPPEGGEGDESSPTASEYDRPADPRDVLPKRKPSRGWGGR